MSSLKMTFSLASLVLILGMVFVTTPVMAQRTIDRVLDIGNSVAASDDADDLTGISGNATAIPAGGYLVIYRAETLEAAGLPGLPANNAISASWVTMPDLEALFGEEGGTILLKIAQTNVNADGELIATGAAGIGLKPVVSPFTEYRYDHDSDDLMVKVLLQEMMALKIVTRTRL